MPSGPGDLFGLQENSVCLISSKSKGNSNEDCWGKESFSEEFHRSDCNLINLVEVVPRRCLK